MKMDETWNEFFSFNTLKAGRRWSIWSWDIKRLVQQSERLFAAFIFGCRMIFSNTLHTNLQDIANFQPDTQSILKKFQNRHSAKILVLILHT
jgi:hypothetical protein